MGRFRKLDTCIWNDEKFRRLSVLEKLETLRRITFDEVEGYFQQYAGPVYRVADTPKRRPDLSTSAWRRLRLEVIAAQGTTCAYCKEDCALDPTIDHVISVHNGADPLEKDNLIVSCRPCNSRKGGREGWK